MWGPTIMDWIERKNRKVGDEGVPSWRYGVGVFYKIAWGKVIKATLFLNKRWKKRDRKHETIIFSKDKLAN